MTAEKSRIGRHCRSVLKLRFSVIVWSFVFLLGCPDTGGNHSREGRGISTPPGPLSLLELVDESRIQDTVTQLQSLGNRMTWEKQWEAARWIQGKFREYGINAVVHTYEWDGRKWPNVVGTIPGSVKTDRAVMAFAHLDSKSYDERMQAPGADDNASGVALVLETARILRHANVEMNVLFCVFSNEETGAAGSRAFVADSVQDAKSIIAAINLDVLGYNRPNSIPLVKALDAAQSSFKYKIRVAVYRTFRNYFLGYFNGSNVVVVAGKPANEQLVRMVSERFRSHSKLRVKEIVSEGCA